MSVSGYPSGRSAVLEPKMAIPQRGGVRATIIYDNNPYDPALKTGWGFACLLETAGVSVLFDTGGDGSTLLRNMAALGIDPQRIDAVVLSHSHGDHTGGLTALLDVISRPPLYVPAAFPVAIKESLQTHADLVQVTRPMAILPGVHTTGEVASYIVEQGLVLETHEGSVVVTGCAHPGIVEMVRRARAVVDGEVALVMGGFHLRVAGRPKVEHIIAELEGLGVRRVAPCHCTGERARGVFESAFGADYFPAGVGWAITIGGANSGEDCENHGS
jgi:7,8-dihydropterin-6-yl-methyl-4-(beta-D-ribofuranosyl)aminobenzene 5'-phosphate synthase